MAREGPVAERGQQLLAAEPRGAAGGEEYRKGGRGGG
jgi:hypothetical protein